MFEAFGIAGVTCGAIAGIGYGLAALVREYYRGRATLLRAAHDIPEPVQERSAVPAFRPRHDLGNSDHSLVACEDSIVVVVLRII